MEAKNVSTRTGSSPSSPIPIGTLKSQLDRISIKYQANIAKAIHSCVSAGLRRPRLEDANEPLKAEDHRVLKWTPRSNGFCRMMCHEVPCIVNGISANAFPDTGSSVDAISEGFAKQHGLEIVANGATTISLPGGSKVESVGIVVGDFLFQGEKHVHHREFHVLRNSIFDLVLGGKFLRSTETLTTYRHRIIEKFRTGIRKGTRLFLLDDAPEEYLRCTVNGAEAVALPDTGSDLMVVSGEFARRNNFKVLRNEKYRQQVELINGFTIRTSGMVLDAELQFDIPDTAPYLDADEYFELTDNLSSILGSRKPMSTPHLRFVSDLHVIEDLPCDIILSNEFISRNQVFSRFKGLFYSTSTESRNDLSFLDRSLLVLRQTKGKWPWIRRLGRRSRDQADTPLVPLEAGASYDEKQQVEIRRRNFEECRISTLQDPERKTEQEREKERQALWDRDNPDPRQPRQLSEVAPGGQSADGGLTLPTTSSTGGSVDVRSPESSIATASSSGPVAVVAMRAPMTVESDPGQTSPGEPRA